MIFHEQTIFMKYHALFVIFEKNSKIWNCRRQIIGGALRVKALIKLLIGCLRVKEEEKWRVQFSQNF